MVSHVPRAALASRFPVHITLRLRTGLPGLRNKQVYAAMRTAFVAGCGGEGFRLVHYSVQTNHLHLIVEAMDRPSLAGGMHALEIRLARALNRLWNRRGAVFADRYHSQILRTPRQVRNALCYVLNNALRHGRRLRGRPDPFTSGAWFDGWKGVLTVAGLEGVERPVVEARTWLLRKGWRRHGLIGFGEVPGPRVVD